MSTPTAARTTLVLGTRASKLALQQSEWFQEQVQAIAPHVTVTLTRIQTSGDKIVDVPAGSQTHIADAADDDPAE